MQHGSPTPTLEQFKDACRREFSFLFELGYSELQNPDSAEPFKVLFSNGTLTVSIRGENYGQHAGVTFLHNDGREAPPVMFVPRSERTWRPPFDPTGFSQLDDIRHYSPQNRPLLSRGARWRCREVRCRSERVAQNDRSEVCAVSPEPKTALASIRWAAADRGILDHGRRAAERSGS